MAVLKLILDVMENTRHSGVDNEEQNKKIIGGFNGNFLKNVVGMGHRFF